MTTEAKAKLFKWFVTIWIVLITILCGVFLSLIVGLIEWSADLQSRLEKVEQKVATQKEANRLD